MGVVLGVGVGVDVGIKSYIVAALGLCSSVEVALKELTLGIGGIVRPIEDSQRVSGGKGALLPNVLGPYPSC